MEPTTDTTRTDTTRIPLDKSTDPPVRPDPAAGRTPPAPVPDPFIGPAPEPTPVPQGRPRFTLRRSRTERMLGGVCGGLARSLDVDVTLLRLGLVTVTVLGAGVGVLLYLAAWVLAPQEGTD